MRWFPAATLALLVSSGAQAQAKFGDKGVISPFGSVRLSWQSDSIGPSSQSTTSLSLQPGVFYFLQDGIAIGGQIGLSLVSASATTVLFRLGPAAGYNHWLADRVSIFPQLALELVVGSAGSSSPGGSSSAVLNLALEIFAPILYHPVPHFFLGIGPIFSADLVSKFGDNDSTKTTLIGIQSVIGGHL